MCAAVRVANQVSEFGNVLVEAADEGEGFGRPACIVLRLLRSFEVSGKAGCVAAEARGYSRRDGSGAGTKRLRRKAALVGEKCGETPQSRADGDIAGTGFGVESAHRLDEFEW